MEILGILATVLTASLFGSLHCGVMCGPIFLRLGSSQRVIALYHVGRLIGYLSLGTVAGILGSVSFSKLLASHAGIVSTLIVSAFFVFSGARLVVGRSVWVNNPFSLALHKAAATGSRFLSRLKNLSLRGLGLGLVTACLPCGWLYLFVATAVVLADPAYGAALLLVFWLGTLPVFSILRELKIGLLGQWSGFGNTVAGCLLILLGVFLPFMRLTSFSHQGVRPLIESPAFLVNKLTGGEATLILPEGVCRGR